MAKKITQLTAAVVGDLAATTAALEVATNVTSTPLSRKITLGVLRDFLASAGTGFAAVAVTVLSLGIGTAPVSNRAVVVGGSVVASSGTARGILSSPTLVAGANNDNLAAAAFSPTFTPGTYTGVAARGFIVNAFSVAAFTSPADPIGFSIGAITGTGATNAFGLLIAPPTGATNNYLISHTTPAIFNVTSAGLGTFTGITLAPASVLKLGNARSPGIVAQGGTVAMTDSAGTVLQVLVA